MNRLARPLAILSLLLLAGHFAIFYYHNARLYETQIFYVTTILLTLFAIINCWHLYGGKTTAAFFVIGSILGWTIEEVGVATGFPFGAYTYTDAMGPLLGHVPYVIPPAWAVLIYLVLTVSNLIVEHAPVGSTGPGRIFALSVMAALITATYDLGLDPFMAFRAKTWIFPGPPGPYFGVPSVAYPGWMFAGFVISLAFRLAQRELGTSPPAPPSRLVAVQPLLAFAGFAVFYALFGFPEGTRIAAGLALGTSVVAAAAGLMLWRPAEPSRGA